MTWRGSGKPAVLASPSPTTGVDLWDGQGVPMTSLPRFLQASVPRYPSTDRAEGHKRVSGCGWSRIAWPPPAADSLPAYGDQLDRPLDPERKLGMGPAE